jgi:hypothetical protein
MNKLNNILLEELNKIKSLIGEQSTITPKTIPSDRLGPGGQFQVPKIELPTFKGKQLYQLSPAEMDEYYKSKFITDPCSFDPKGLDVMYRQQAVSAPGYYSDFSLGECSAVEYFTGDETAIDCMDLSDYDVFEDDQGQFITVKGSGAENVEVKVYLPTKEFFQQMTGKVKSFMAFDTCSTACKFKQTGSSGIGMKQGENIFGKYSLLYQLKNPSGAIGVTTITPEGPKMFGLEGFNRGWELQTGLVMESGYFGNVQGNDEYTNAKYQDQMGRSEFDIWYDGVGGTIVQIGVAVILSYVTAGMAAPFLAGIVSQGARITANLAIQTAVELTVAIPEAIYLHGRGMNTNAAFVLMLSLIPVAQAKVFGGEFADPVAYGYVHELTRKYGTGEFRTPADLKRYVNNLPPPQRKSLEGLLKQTQDALIKGGGQLAREEVAAVMGIVIKNSDKGVDNLGFQIASGVLSKEISKFVPTTTQAMLKNLVTFGGTLGAAFAIHPVLGYIVKDAIWVKNPQKLQPISETSKKLQQVIGERQSATIQKEIQSLQEKMDMAIYKQDKTKAIEIGYEIMFVYDDLLSIAELRVTIGDQLSEQKKVLKSRVIGALLVQIETQIRNELNETNGKYSKTLDTTIDNGFKVNKDELFKDLVNRCKSEALFDINLNPKLNMDNPTDKDLKFICSFRAFMWDNYKSILNPKEFFTCDEFESRPETKKPPKWFYLQDCQLKKFWNQTEPKSGKRYCELWKEAVKSKKTKPTTTIPGGGKRTK